MSAIDWFFGDGDSPAWWQRGHALVLNVLRAMHWPIVVFLLLSWLTK